MPAVHRAKAHQLVECALCHEVKTDCRIRCAHCREPADKLVCTDCTLDIVSRSATKSRCPFCRSHGYGPVAKQDFVAHFRRILSSRGLDTAALTKCAKMKKYSANELREASELASEASPDVLAAVWKNNTKEVAAQRQQLIVIATRVADKMQSVTSIMNWDVYCACEKIISRLLPLQSIFASLRSAPTVEQRCSLLAIAASYSPLDLKDALQSGFQAVDFRPGLDGLMNQFCMIRKVTRGIAWRTMHHHALAFYITFGARIFAVMDSSGNDVGVYSSANSDSVDSDDSVDNDSDDSDNSGDSDNSVDSVRMIESVGDVRDNESNWDITKDIFADLCKNPQWLCDNIGGLVRSLENESDEVHVKTREFLRRVVQKTIRKFVEYATLSLKELESLKDIAVELERLVSHY